MNDSFAGRCPHVSSYVVRRPLARASQQPPSCSPWAVGAGRTYWRAGPLIAGAVACAMFLLATGIQFAAGGLTTPARSESSASHYGTQLDLDRLRIDMECGHPLHRWRMPWITPHRTAVRNSTRHNRHEGYTLGPTGRDRHPGSRVQAVDRGALGRAVSVGSRCELKARPTGPSSFLEDLV